MAIDRRVARMRTALYDALVALIRRKDYDLITVEDILREANVGRSTFYAHFTSKDDLLERSLERLKALLVAAQQHSRKASHNRSDERRAPSRVLFEHVAEFADVQLALAGGRGGAIVDEAIDDVLADILRASLPSKSSGDLPRELIIRHVISTFGTTLRWWFANRSSMSAAEAEVLFKRLLLEGLPADACGTFIAPPD